MAIDYAKSTSLVGFGAHATVDLRITLAVISLWAVTVLLVKLVQEVRNRRERLSYFKRGGVPQIPTSSAILGDLRVIVRSDNIKIFDNYHKKLGKTFGAFYGPYAWAFTMDADLIQKIFVTEGNKFIDTQLFHLPFVSELNKSIAQLREKDWRPLRRALNPSFNNKQMKSDNVFQDLEITIGRLINCVENHPMEKSSADTNEEAYLVDVLYNFRKFTVDLIFRVAYDNNEIIDWTPMKNDVTIDKLVDAAYKVRNPLTYLSIVFGGTQRFFGYLTQFTTLGDHIAYFQKIIGETIVRRRKLAPEKIQQNRKMIDSLMEGVKRTGLDEETLRANMFFLFVAGFDTTANSLSAIIWLLAKHPDKQDKLRAALMTEGDNCEYLTWCIKEGLRLYPAAPTGIGRDVPEDFEFKGMKFFKGSSIVVNIYSVHRDRDYWGDDYEVFKPERFGDASNHHPAQFIPFALGPRNCIGYNFAMLEMRTVVARMVAKYRLECHPTTPDEITYSAQNLLTLSVHGPINIKLVKIA